MGKEEKLVLIKLVESKEQHGARYWEENRRALPDDEEEIYKALEEAYTKGDRISQLFWFDHLINEALAITDSPQYREYFLFQLTALEERYLFTITKQKPPSQYKSRLLARRNELAKIRQSIHPKEAIQKTQTAFTKSAQSLLAALIDDTIALLGIKKVPANIQTQFRLSRRL